MEKEEEEKEEHRTTGSPLKSNGSDISVYANKRRQQTLYEQSLFQEFL